MESIISAKIYIQTRCCTFKITDGQHRVNVRELFSFFQVTVIMLEDMDLWLNNWPHKVMIQLLLIKEALEIVKAEEDL